MKYTVLIWKNITRNKTRTVLTICSYAAAFALFGVFSIMNNSLHLLMNSAKDSLVTFERRYQVMPYAYKEKIKKIPGVTYIVANSNMPLFYKTKDNYISNIATEPEYIKVHSEFTMPKEQWENWLKDREGCFVGKIMAEEYNWKVGDRIPLLTRDGSIELNISAIASNEAMPGNTQWLFWHREYLDEYEIEELKNMVADFQFSIDDGNKAEEICRKIDDMFMNSSYETRTNSWNMLGSGLVRQQGNEQRRLMTIGGAAFLSLLLVTSCSMFTAVRERTGEIGVLKTLGFTDMIILSIVISEAILYAMIGGGIGLLLLKIYIIIFEPYKYHPVGYDLTLHNAINGLLLAIIFGAAAGMIPGINSMRLRVIDTLRRV